MRWAGAVMAAVALCAAASGPCGADDVWPVSSAPPDDGCPKRMQTIKIRADEGATIAPDSPVSCPVGQTPAPSTPLASAAAAEQASAGLSPETTTGQLESPQPSESARPKPIVIAGDNGGVLRDYYERYSTQVAAGLCPCVMPRRPLG